VNRAAPKAVTSYSNYLSIWRKEPDGRWRVFIDFGISVPEPARYEPGFTRFPFEDRYRGQQATADAAGALLAADRELNDRIASDGAAAAYKARLTNASRLNREGFVPVVGPSAIAAWLGQHTPRLTARSGSSGASGAGDLGYTYGTYETAGEKPEAGAYVRIWMRNANGRWLVVADVTQGKR
jgi:ketosteroid isomerase-like protein